MKQVAIIGAGAAGLAAAQQLTRRGVGVTIYEKSQGVGGRAATRRVNGCVIDHGAQVMQAPTRELRQLVTGTMPDGLPGARDIGHPIWTFDVENTISEGDPERNADPKWCWPAGFNTLGKALAVGLDVRRGVRIHHLYAHAEGNGYDLRDEQGQTVATADAVLLTPPAPQTADLIAASMLPQNIRDTLLAELASVTYRRCLSVALAYARRPWVPWYALVNLDRQHPISWLGCEHAKPDHAPTGTGLLIAQMAHDFSLSHWDAAEKGTYGEQGEQGAPLPPHIAQVHAAVQTLLDDDLGMPLWADLHRWRYALPNPETGARFDLLNGTGSGLYVAGDYIEGRGRVSEAIECGWRVAEVMYTAL